ncbi:Neuroligin-3 [Branchiostoma belcheri]|nr:Neuroligin-3 [Branchiostoma belcheri]
MPDSCITAAASAQWNTSVPDIVSLGRRRVSVDDSTTIYLHSTLPISVSGRYGHTTDWYQQAASVHRTIVVPLATCSAYRAGNSNRPNPNINNRSKIDSSKVVGREKLTMSHLPDKLSHPFVVLLSILCTAPLVRTREPVPPTGMYRFKQAKLQAPKWTGERNATSFGPACMQAVRKTTMTTPSWTRQQVASMQPYLQTLNEDCLFLNIYRPINKGKLSDQVFMAAVIGNKYLFPGDRAIVQNSTSMNKLRGTQAAVIGNKYLVPGDRAGVQNSTSMTKLRCSEKDINTQPALGTCGFISPTIDGRYGGLIEMKTKELFCLDDILTDRGIYSASYIHGEFITVRAVNAVTIHPDVSRLQTHLEQMPGWKSTSRLEHSREVDVVVWVSDERQQDYRDSSVILLKGFSRRRTSLIKTGQALPPPRTFVFLATSHICFPGGSAAVPRYEIVIFYFYFYVILVKTPHWGITTRVLGARLSAAGGVMPSTTKYPSPFTSTLQKHKPYKGSSPTLHHIHITITPPAALSRASSNLVVTPQ